MAQPAGKKKTKVTDAQRLLTPEFRVAFPNVFKPAAMKGGAPKYSVTMLFPKTSDMKPLMRAIKAAKVAAFGSDESAWPEIQSAIKNGDKPSKTGQVYEGFAGNWVIRASSNENSKPGVFDEDVKPITEPSLFYPGCYAIAYCFAYVWEFNGEHGVGFILDHVQKQRDGKAFGGKKPGDQIFKPVQGRDTDEELSEADDEDLDADF